MLLPILLWLCSTSVGGTGDSSVTSKHERQRWTSGDTICVFIHNPGRRCGFLLRRIHCYLPRKKLVLWLCPLRLTLTNETAVFLVSSLLPASVRGISECLGGDFCVWFCCLSECVYSECLLYLVSAATHCINVCKWEWTGVIFSCCRNKCLILSEIIFCETLNYLKTFNIHRTDINNTGWYMLIILWIWSLKIQKVTQLLLQNKLFVWLNESRSTTKTLCTSGNSLEMCSCVLKYNNH